MTVTKQFIAYFRVSTVEQEGSGLGLEAQQEKVRQLVKAKGGELISEFTEIESGRKTNRPVLAECLMAARKSQAVVVVAKLDRLARDAELVNRLSKEVAGNGFPGLLFADLPDVDATNAAGRMILGVMAQGVISYRDVFLFMLYRERTEMWHGRFHRRQPLLYDKSKYEPDEASEEQLLPVL